ncbi:MAG: PQQ-binding-like beta-propeller repeat protein [Candidatus Lokiarchaeota archaeon]|nr:PQQ-binding-like beta-propeller repeat protein [Candidatus Lokiarchaeota archaeon]
MKNKVNTMKKGIIFVVASLMMLSVINVASATDWTMYGFDLANTGFTPDDAPDEKRIFVEEKLLDGYDHSNDMVVANGKLYFNTKSQTSTLYCVDALNPTEELWSQPIGISYTSSPTISGNKLYIGTSQYLYCFNAETGNEIWTFDTQAANTQATVFNGNVYFFDYNDEVFYCANANTGQELWSKQMNDRPRGRPVIYNDNVYITESPPYNGPSVIYCLDINNEGAEIWTHALPDETVQSIAIDNDKVFVSNDKTVYCLDAIGNGDGTTDEIWNQGPFTYTLGPPSVAYGNVYVTNNYDVFCLDQDDGAEVWIFTCPNHRVDRDTKLTIADDKVLFGTVQYTDVKLYALDAHGDEGTTDVIWEHSIGSGYPLQTSAVVVDGLAWFMGRGAYLVGMFSSITTVPTIDGVDEAKVNEIITFEAMIDDITPLPPGNVQYMFDFGDGVDTYWLPSEVGVTMDDPFEIDYQYDEPGNYQVKTKVRHVASGLESDWSEPHNIYVSFMDIVSVTGGFGVNIAVRNYGDLDKDVDWSVDLIGGSVPGFHFNKHYEGSVEPLKANSTTIISTPMMFGLGDFDIKLKVEYAGEPPIEEVIEGRILFFYVML